MAVDRSSGRWLTADGRPVAPLEVAAGRKARRRGLLGRSGIKGALLLRPASSIHTFGMRFPIDVAVCNRSLRVVEVKTLPAGRLTRPRLLTTTVFEAEAGALEAWGIQPGTQLGIGEPPERCRGHRPRWLIPLMVAVVLLTVLLVVLAFYAAVNIANQDSAWGLEVGDCWNEADSLTGGGVETVEIVSCSKPHDFEAYPVFEMEDGSRHRIPEGRPPMTDFTTTHTVISTDTHIESHAHLSKPSLPKHPYQPPTIRSP